ncbi:hypothetical protein QQ045_032881 [Rhodiola kirilowii]
MLETSRGKAQGKARQRNYLHQLPVCLCVYIEEETESSESSEDEASETEDGNNFKIVLSNGNPQPKNQSKTDGQKKRYHGFETRTTPNTLPEAIRTHTDPQRVAVGSMGLDGMLHLRITKVPTQFAKWLLKSFNSKTCKLETPRGDAEILPKDVNFTLGLPMGSRPIKVHLRMIPDALLVQTFQPQYGGPRANKVKCTEVSKMIQASNEANDAFKLIFLVMFYSTIVDSTKTRKANQSILNAIEGIDDIRALNRGEFMIERLRHSKDEWEKSKGNPYTTPMPLLVVIFL